MVTDNIQIRPIIGMEIHVQLDTRTKMFCACPVEFAAEPNSRVCPVCLGLPGSLPVINRRAVELSIKAALALDCEIARFTKWDRKQYYYPDLPKNYQISQYDLPLAAHGRFEAACADGVERPVRILRAHLEEDAGKNTHEGLDHTRVDLNRTGTPLLEIVTEPDIIDAEQAYAFCTRLQRLVQYLGVSEGNMQKGQMRFEPNVNVAITHEGREYRTPISEVKNLNSFRAVRGAVQYEIDRQIRAWQEDHDYTLDKLGKMNFGWNDDKGETEFQRGKEESHDYRYFPDPDLVPVVVDDGWLDELKADVGELPFAREARFVAEYGITPKDCEVILADRRTGTRFEEAIAAGAKPETLTRQFLGLWSHLAASAHTTIGGLALPSGVFAEIAALVDDGTISATAAAQVAEQLHTRGTEKAASPKAIAEELGLIQQRDESALQAWVDEAFANNPQAVEDAQCGDARKMKASTGFLRGQVMKLSQGAADPRLAGELIEKKLKDLTGN